MNRRGFLQLLAPAAAGLLLPELLVPRRTFFLPPPGGWTGSIEALAFRRPDAALFELLDYIKGLEEKIGGVSWPYLSESPPLAGRILQHAADWPMLRLSS